MNKTITAIDPGSIAEELGITPGDILISIDGRTIQDVFDYRMAIAGPDFEMLVQKGVDGEEWLLAIEKDDDEDLGLGFADGLMDDVKSCANNCIFCFIRQNPAGIMRDTIYFRDDDYRLSFFHGNYITLTNMTQADVDRILAHRISPINISVHTTNGDLRAKMLDNPRAAETLAYIEQLAAGGISLGLQIVLCKNYNDGAELDSTIGDLARLAKQYRGDYSLSVVPAGLTRHREGLPPILPFTQEDCRAIIAQVEHWQTHMLSEIGTRFVYCADELYITANTPLPPHAAYEDFPQIENGVGMIAAFRHDFEQALQELDTTTTPYRKITIVTGIAAQAHIADICRLCCEHFRDLQIDVVSIRNEFFGHAVSVAGLLTGQDIAAGLAHKDLGDLVILPKNCLRRDTDMLLDNMTVTELAARLDTKFIAADVWGSDFLAIVKGE